MGRCRYRVPAHRWYGEWELFPSPAEEERALGALRLEREARALREGRLDVFRLETHDERAWWSCTTLSGNTYRLTTETCECEDWVRTCQPLGLECKHILALRDRLARAVPGAPQQRPDRECKVQG